MFEGKRIGCSLDELLAFHCAPVLLGEKTGNLFSIRKACFERMRNRYREIGVRLAPLGINLELLLKRRETVLLYVYRPELLDADMRRPEAQKLLFPLRYRRGHLIQRLRARLAEEKFPHEIGLFLGYPPNEVVEFIKNHGENSKYCGCWKVYGDVESAKRCFARYDQCRALLCDCVERGQEIEEVIRSVLRRDA